MLSQDDIYRLEIRVRLHAESLRKAAESFDTSAAPEVRSYAARVRIDADEFDQVGNLLVGLQGDWTRLGPMVREGYKAVMAEFERKKADAAARRSEAVHGDSSDPELVARGKALSAA
ncbi:hypothetical protein [Devosia sp. Root105]|uniref:hypothetical protein n=1 Tax=Devosia sp. Root105 TaxID=1736423 RepID=UPI000700EAE0|nr:hypothetical protein [Devosia sp. Root105]KQU96458.1 hypothetical protein ASC68_13855 [Devosia sp. Root105]